MLNRRNFIKRGLITAGTLALIPTWAFRPNEMTKLVVLHTNDLHCRFEPFPNTDPKFAGKGGMNRISAYAKALRKVEPQLLMLDCGDFSQGTPYYNFFGSELVLKMMTEMGYDASTIGNHEFDLGLDDLSNAMNSSGFPLVSSNYDFTGTPMERKIVKSLVLERNGLRIGIYGLGIELQGLVDKNLYGPTSYANPIHTALEQEEFLRTQERCDFIICLSHLGYEYKNEKTSDCTIAAKTNTTDLILGGHTHTFLASPVEVINRRGEPVVVNQVGWGSLMLGQLEFYFERRKKRVYDLGPNKPVG
jgi:5'-nucleotidase